MQRLRIAQISNLNEPINDSTKNGLSQIVYSLTQELVNLGHDVTLYAPSRSSTGARLVPLSNQKSASKTILGKVLPVAAAFSDWRHFDIIHDHTRFFSTLFAHLIPIPVVSTVHHPVEFDELHWHHPAEEYRVYFRPKWETFLESVHSVFVSQYQRARFNGKGHVIYNGIPLNKWPEPNFVSGKHLAFLGSINELKGTHEAIKAALLAEEALIIAGITDENGEYFQRKIHPFIDGERVKYIGSLNFKEKTNFLAGAKAVLMPIQWDDPLPTVALESLASGTPVIAWDRSSMPEIIENNKTGFLVSSIEEMAARIQEIHTIDRRACRSRVERLFNSKQMAIRYVNLYHALCTSSGPQLDRPGIAF